MQNKTGSLIIEIEIGFINNTITFLIISIINKCVGVITKRETKIISTPPKCSC